MDRKNVPLVGIAGGIASGKSFIAEQFERLGAAVVSADRWAHEVLKLDEIKHAVRERWGDGAFGPDGKIDRAALGRIVFATPGELKHLEELTHPKIGQQVRQEITELAAKRAAAAIVLDVPLLFESGWNNFCDFVVFVEVPRDVRVERATGRGWTEDDFARREAAQESLETKRKLADVVIDNSGSPESAQAQVERFWHSLVGSSPPN